MIQDLQMIGCAHETAVGDTSIAWGEMGSGRPLVLLHGLMDSHRVWRRAAPLLARHFRVLMPDLSGHGWSGRPDAPYTLSWHAAVLAAWMEAIDVPSAHVCGHYPQVDATGRSARDPVESLCALRTFSGIGRPRV